MQSKITTRCHYTFIIIGKIKNRTYAVNDMKRLNHSYIADGNMRDLSHSGKIWHATTIWSNNSILGNLSQKSDNLGSFKNLYANFYGNFIFRNQNIKTAYVSFSRQMVKETVVCIYLEIQPSNKKEHTIETCSNLSEEPLENYAEKKNPTNGT